jgi:dUTP pyrophosphatase
MNVKIKRLNKLAKIPTRGTAESAGYDLYAATDKDIQIPPHSNVKIGTGIAMSIPNGFFGGIFARSGVATKRNMRPSNCVGIVDSDYTGEVIVSIHNDSTETKTIQRGERIAQLVIVPYLSVMFDEVNELDETDRGDGGFGSTGEK